MNQPLRDHLEAIVSQGSDDHAATVDTLLDAMRAVAKAAFIPNTAKWLDQVKAGDEFRL